MCGVRCAVCGRGKPIDNSHRNGKVDQAQATKYKVRSTGLKPKATPCSDVWDPSAQAIHTCAVVDTLAPLLSRHLGSINRLARYHIIAISDWRVMAPVMWHSL
jgi:hypothetical protein